MIFQNSAICTKRNLDFDERCREDGLRLLKSCWTGENRVLTAHIQGEKQASIVSMYGKHILPDTLVLVVLSPQRW